MIGTKKCPIGKTKWCFDYEKCEDCSYARKKITKIIKECNCKHLEAVISNEDSAILCITCKLKAAVTNKENCERCNVRESEEGTEIRD